MKLQKLYKAYKKAQAESDKLDKLVTAGNYDLEAEWDEAYNTYWNLREAVISEMINLLGISREIANKMLATEKMDDLMNKTIA